MADIPADEVRALYGELESLPRSEWRSVLRSRGVPIHVEQEVLELLSAGLEPAPVVARLAPKLKRTMHASPEVEGYRVGDELGDGATGQVFSAMSRDGGQRVAIKILRYLGTSGEEAKRFRREARILESLEHPGIAGFVGATVAQTPVGTVPALVMELIDGQPIRAHCDVHDLGDAQRVALVAGVCDALAHAHERGVVHRDLKPANVLVRDGHRPVVVDFGVAHLACPGVDDSVSRTRDGDLLGTLAYMAPEQASGEPGAGGGVVDPRRDVYSAGAVLFELLTGQHPIRLQNASLTEAIQRLSVEEARGLEELRPELGGDLSTILSRALAKDPQARYESASALAADLRRYLAGGAIEAQPFGAWDLVRRFARRHRALTFAACTAVVGLALGATGLGMGWLRARSAQAVAERSAEETNEILGAVVDLLHAPVIEKRGHRVTVSELLDRVGPKLLAAEHLSPETSVAVHRSIGESLRTLGRYGRAREHLGCAVEAALAQGLPPSKVADLVAERAEAEREMDDTEVALASLDQARRLRVEAHGEESLAVLGTDLRVAFALAAMGRYTEALALAEETHGRLASGIGQGAIELDRAEHVWGGILLEQRTFVPGEAHLRRAIEGFRARGTEEDVASATHNLGVLLRLASRFDEGLAVSQEALELSTAARGADHPQTFFCLGARGLARKHNIDSKGALADLEAACAGIRATFGEAHEETLILDLSRAEVLFEVGRREEAVELSGRVARAHFEARRRNNASLTAFNSHAQHLNRTGDVEGSLEWLERARGVARVLHDEHSAFCITLDTNAAHVFVTLGRTEEALDQLWDVHRRLALSEDAGDSERMIVKANLGRGLSAAGRHDEGARWLREAVDHSRDYLEEGHTSRVLVMKLLAEALAKGGHPTETRACLTEARAEIASSTANLEAVSAALDELERGLGPPATVQ